MRPYMYKAYQSSFNIEKYFIFLKTTQKHNEHVSNASVVFFLIYLEKVAIIDTTFHH